ncbi:MAG: ATP-binding protein [Pseudomonadota bacterium]
MEQHDVQTAAAIESAAPERLREIILDLEQSREREARLRREADWLLSGLRALVASDDVSDAFRLLLSVFKEALELDAAVVLDQSPGGRRLTASLATDAALAGATVANAGSFARCLSGRTVMLADVGAAEEWSAFRGRAGDRVGSAILAPLIASTRRAVLVGVKREKAFFSGRHARLMDRLTPLARQAILGLEQRERLASSLRRFKALIDGAPYGVLSIEADLTIGPEYSSGLPQVLRLRDPDIAGRKAVPLLSQCFELSGEKGEAFAETLTLSLGESAINWDLNKDHLPSEIVLGGLERRELDLVWTPMIDPETDQVSSVLVAIRDVTRERATAAALAAQRRSHEETLAMLDVLLSAPKARFSRFFAEADMRLDYLEPALRDPDGDRRRILIELHTLKGAARLLGLDNISGAIHDLEDKVKARPGASAAVLSDRAAFEDWSRLFAAYEPLRRVFRDVLDEEDQGAGSLMGLAEPHLAGARQALAEHGLECAVSVVDAAGCAPDRLAPALTVALQHITTNMVDHSILPARRRDGRSHATIELEARWTAGPGSEIRLTLRDDGTGFDLPAIARRAAEAGLSQDPEQPLEVLFEPGFSTAAAVTTRCGRGIGMAAVRDAIEQVGGRIELSNRPVGGSEIAITVPSSGCCSARTDRRLPIEADEQLQSA